MITKLLQYRRLQALADRLYVGIVEQARKPWFYAGAGVPDSLDGRFEMVTMHVFLITRCLKGKEDSGQRLARYVMETMFSDMDRSLREIGVGDLSVGRKVKQMAAAFFGRAQAYEAGLGGGDAALREALLRNVYAGKPPAAGAVVAMAGYLRAAAAAIEAGGPDEILRGGLHFPVPGVGQKSVDRG